MKDKFKIIASDTAVYGLSTMIGRFLTFLLTPFYTNFLDPSDLGFVTYIHLAYVILLTISSFGLENSYFRFYSDSNKSSLFKTAFLVMFGNALFIFGIFYFGAQSFSDSINGNDVVINMIKYQSFVVLLDIVLIVPFAKLRMERKSVKFGLINLFKVLVSISFNYYFIAKLSYQGDGVFLAQAIASFLTAIIVIPIIYRSFFDSADDKPKASLKDLIWFGLPTVPASLATLLLRSGDHFIIKEILGAGELAIYSTNYKLALPMMMFLTAFDQAWRPYYMKNHNEQSSKEFFQKMLTVFVAISGMLFLIISLFVDYVVTIPFVGGNFINEYYWEGLGIIPYILGAYFLLGCFNFFAMGINIAKKTKYLPLAVGIAAGFNIVMNILFLEQYGYIISAYLTTISYFISASILFYFSNKYYPLKFEWKRIYFIITLTLTMYFLTHLGINKIGGFNEAIFKTLSLLTYIAIIYYIVFNKYNLRRG